MLDKLNKYYEVINHRNAIGVLESGSPEETTELVDALLKFRMSINDIKTSGG